MICLGIFVIQWDGSPELKMFFICFSTLCWCVLFRRRTLDFHGWRDALPRPTMCSTPFTVETLAKDFCRYFEPFLSFPSPIFSLFFPNIGVRSCLWTEVTASVKLFVGSFRKLQSQRVQSLVNYPFKQQRLETRYEEFKLVFSDENTSKRERKSISDV